MTPLPRVFTVAEVAEALDETTYYVEQKCRRREWPHLRGARGKRTFTAEQYEQILTLRAQAPVDSQPRGLSFAPRSGRKAS